jgi:ABC-type Co2+ transport system permease subunit
MGIPALIAGSIYNYFKKQLEDNPVFASSLAGIFSAFAVILSAVFISLELMLAGQEFATVSKTILLVNAIIGVVEGIITFFLFSIILKVKPQMVFDGKKEI